MNNKAVLSFSLLFALGGCGGGGESSNPTSTGVFIDSPVINISYRTETQNGVTNSRGEFKYYPGETVTFFIGDLEFPSVPADERVTPLDMADTDDVFHHMVVNIARLLLSVHSPSAVLFSWHSGFPSEGWGTAVGPGGQLLSQEGYLPDARGLTNMLVGYADSFVYSDSFLFWNSLDSAADAYDNDLTYCLFPERSESLFGSCTGYNSNSYATGLIKSRSGNIVPLPGAFGIQHTLTDADRYPGVQKPVPSENF